ncbi:MAG: sortase [Clostridiales bacterium]|nr:sortase [Clostridiales bacterium]
MQRPENAGKIKWQARRFWQTLEVLCLLVFLLMVILIAVRMHETHRRKAEENASLAQMESLSETAPEATSAMRGDMRDLYMQNDDFVGIVEFADMALYVCRGEDNVYYASHRLDGSEDPGGMIFMDYACTKESENIILYGHNMNDGTRFGKLKRFADREYIEKYPVIRFAGLYETHEFVPFSVFYTSTDFAMDNHFDYIVTELDDEAAFDDYTSEVKWRSLFDLDVDTAFGDRLLTLSTCSNELGDENGMLVIVCREKRSGE